MQCFYNHKQVRTSYPEVGPKKVKELRVLRFLELHSVQDLTMQLALFVSFAKQYNVFFNAWILLHIENLFATLACSQS